MSLAIDIRQSVTTALQAAQGAVRAEDLALVGGRGAANEIRAHLAGLESTRPNKQGWPRQHFWAKARRSVQAPRLAGGGAIVSLTHPGIGLRYFGGTTRPIARKYMTIPATEEAYGHSAREFSNLRFGFAENRFGNLAPALIERDHTALSFGRKRKDGTRGISGKSRGGRTFYWLVKRAFHPADSTVLPTPEALSSAAVNAVTGVVARALEQPPP